MNTLRSKPPKRYSDETPLGYLDRPPGTYVAGITDLNICTAVGSMITDWPHLEESMIAVLGDLLGDIEDAPARQIFRSIVNANIRIKVMRSLLESAAINRDKSAWYDDVISEFASLNDVRNSYVHGLWFTHDTGDVWLAEPSIDDRLWFNPQRRITMAEVELVAERMRVLLRKIDDGEPAPEPSPHTPPELQQ